MPFYEDTTDSPLGVEARLISGVTMPRLNQLLTRLRDSILGELVPEAQARAIVVTAHLFEPGDLYVAYFPPEVFDVEFRSKARVIDVDTALRPFYGLVNPAITELKNRRIDPIIAEMWLEFFRTDNALYRVNVVAGMCLTGALLDEGFRVTV